MMEQCQQTAATCVNQNESWIKNKKTKTDDGSWLAKMETSCEADDGFTAAFSLIVTSRSYKTVLHSQGEGGFWGFSTVLQN